MDPISAMITGGLGLISSLAGGGMNMFNQQAANKQNLLMNSGAYRAQQVQTEASALGVSPLAILGATPQNMPFSPVTGMGDALESMGQNLSRAGFAGRTTDPLSDNLKRAQADNLDAQTASINSRLRVATAPGTPDLPVFGTVMPENRGPGRFNMPYPPEDPRGLGKGDPPVMRPFFSGDPNHPLWGYGKEFGLQFTPPQPLQAIAGPALLGRNTAEGASFLYDQATGIGLDILRRFGLTGN